MNEVQLIELQYKTTQLQFQIIQFVLKEFPETKPDLKPVLLDLAGLSEKKVREIMGSNDKKKNEKIKIVDIIDSDDEEE